jgi:ABC-2 type transport system permease protein
MIGSLIRKAIGDARLLFTALVLLMFIFPVLLIWASSMISLPAFSEFLANALPQRWERVSGVPFSQIATPAGRVALVFVHPLVLFSAVVWAIARGSDCVSGEIGRGTMEMLLAQPVRRVSVYTTQAAVAIAGSALLSSAVWCGTATGIHTVDALSERVSATLFIPPAVNLFALMVCVGGISALASSWDSQRWRTVGLVGAWYAVTLLLEVVGQISDEWQWVSYLSFTTAYEPQAMVARPAEAWSLWTYNDGAVESLGSGGRQLVLLGLGLICYATGAVIFNRREIPAPL